MVILKLVVLNFLLLPFDVKIKKLPESLGLLNQIFNLMKLFTTNLNVVFINIE